MKKLVAILAAVAISAGATVAFANSNPATGVNGSVHDMNVKYSGNKDAMERVCVFCHTPHNANMGGEAAGTYPLWNHDLPDTTGWTSYSWATPLNQTLTIDPMMGPSRLCMSCHDGVIAPDQHLGSNGANAAQAGTGPLTGFKAIGLLGGTAGSFHDLTDDHPIGFSYDDAVLARNVNGARELVDKTSQFATAPGATNVAGTYNDPVRAGKRQIQNVLFNGTIMTCASCHEVHNKDNVPPSVNTSGTAANYLLWADEANSLICLSCHVK